MQMRESTLVQPEEVTLYIENKLILFVTLLKLELLVNYNCVLAELNIRVSMTAAYIKTH